MVKPTFDYLQGELFMHKHKIEDISDLTSPFQFKGEIAVYEELDHRNKKNIEVLKVYTKPKHLLMAINDVSEVKLTRAHL